MLVNNIKYSCCVLLAILAHAVAAAPVYITDKLNVGLHEDKTLDSPIVAVVPSGTQLELVKREDNFSFVSDNKGTTGWVDNSYLLDTPPAGAQVKVLQQQLKTLQAGGNNSPANNADLAKLKSDYDALQQQLKTERLKAGELQVTIAELRKRQGQDSDTDALYQEIDSLKETNKDLQVKLANAMDSAASNAAAVVTDSTQQDASNAKRFTVSWNNMLIMSVVLVVIGLAAGVYLMDYLNRRRHGGFRV